MLKRVIRQSSDGRPAFLFTGFMRGEFADTVLEEFQAVGDVFVVTNKDGSLMYDEVRRRIPKVFSVEENEAWSQTQSALSEMEYGRGLLQWQKFEIGLEQIRNAEEQNSARYTAIYKLRTDINFRSHVLVADANHARSPDCVFMDSDKFFGGNRDTIMQLDGFVEHALAHYCGQSDKFWPIDTKRLLFSDFDAAKFHWLKYPKTLFPFSKGRPKPSELRQRIMDSIGHIDLSSEYLGELVTCREDSPETSWFPSEPSFAHFVIHRGFVAKGLGDHFVAKGEIPLLLDRFEHDISIQSSQGRSLLRQAMKHKGLRRAIEGKRRK